MSEPAFDTVIRGGTVATASDVFSADLGLRDGRIAAIGLDLAPGRREIDATGKLVLPGGSTATPISSSSRPPGS